MHENIQIIKNSRLVGKGCNKKEVIDFDETLTLIARMGVVKTLLAFAWFKSLNSLNRCEKSFN